MSKILSAMKRILVKGNNLALLLMNYLLILCYQPGTSGGVALIRLDHIGDFILWLDAAQSFRQLYPDQKITLVANASWIELAASFSYWDEIIPLETRLFNKNWRYRWMLLQQLRKSGFETAIQPTYSRDFLSGDSLVFVTGARYRIGSQGDYSNIGRRMKRISDQWYSRLVAASSDAQTEIERNAEFVRNMSGHPYVAHLPIIPTLTQLPSYLKINRPYCVIFPGASWGGRRWSVEQFAQTAQFLRQEQQCQIVICGGPNERAIGSKVVSLVGEDVVNLTGQTSLLELIEVIRLSVLLISNETSAVHIAAAVGTPSVCILGGGHFGRFMPYPDGLDHAPIAVFHPMSCFGCNWLCTQPHIRGRAVPCIQKVTVEAVCNAARQSMVCISPQSTDLLNLPNLTKTQKNDQQYN